MGELYNMVLRFGLFAYRYANGLQPNLPLHAVFSARLTLHRHNR
ncbi:hypothetical protein [Stenoxybacter acetivorans]|nr:hypothetical protein [Stenoxybacter acetivorans]